MVDISNNTVVNEIQVLLSIISSKLLLSFATFHEV